MTKLEEIKERILERKQNITHIYNGKDLMLNIYKNRLQPINIQPYNETKWLYELWIAGTEIVDDLEEEN